MVDILVILSRRLSRRFWTKSISPDRYNLSVLGNKSTKVRLRKRADSIKKVGNHPPNLSDGEDVESLLVQVNHWLRHDQNIENPGVFDILLH